jgi:hypothetical protein
MNMNTPDISSFITTQTGNRILIINGVIPPWDMSFSTNIVVTHGVTSNFIPIVVNAMIGIDAELAASQYYWPLVNSTIDGKIFGSVERVDANHIYFNRGSGYGYDNANFSNDVLNRGVWVMMYMLI